MILQPIQGRLNPNNCITILMDYQPQLALTISSAEGGILFHNAINVAKMAKIFNIPTILTTIGKASFGGPLFPKLQEIFPDQQPIDRATLSIFGDTRVLATMEKIGRNNLVIAGLWTDFGVVASIRQARNLGYEVFIVVDACGDVSLRAHRIAVQSILQKGAVPMTWLQMLLELHHDWAPPEAYEVLFNIAKDHASTYGLEIQYAQPVSDEGHPNGSITNQKKEGGKNGPWFRSNHYKRSKKDCDQTSTRISL